MVAAESRKPISVGVPAVMEQNGVLVYVVPLKIQALMPDAEQLTPSRAPVVPVKSAGRE